VTANNVNGESKCFNASICPKLTKLDGQIAQQAGRIRVVPDAGEPLSPQAGDATRPGSPGTVAPGTSEMFGAGELGPVGRPHGEPSRLDTTPDRRGAGIWLRGPGRRYVGT